MRFGLCCLFKDEKITFRTTTTKVLSALPRSEQFKKLSEICSNNTQSLVRAVQTVQHLGIGAFRIMSPLFPRITHPEVGYTLEDLPACWREQAMTVDIEAKAKKLAVIRLMNSVNNRR